MQTCVSLFLFGRAHEELWREQEGVLVALMAPKVRDRAQAGACPIKHGVRRVPSPMDTPCPLNSLAALPVQVRDEGGEFSLSADSADAVWVLGQSPEFGHCKANKKVQKRLVRGARSATHPRLLLAEAPPHPLPPSPRQNGDPCRMPVNTLRCPFCPYHAAAEFQRLRPKQRTEFHGSALSAAIRQQQGRGAGGWGGWRARPSAFALLVLVRELERLPQACSGSQVISRRRPRPASPARPRCLLLRCVAQPRAPPSAAAASGTGMCAQRPTRCRPCSSSWSTRRGSQRGARQGRHPSRPGAPAGWW